LPFPIDFDGRPYNSHTTHRANEAAEIHEFIFRKDQLRDASVIINKLDSNYFF